MSWRLLLLPLAPAYAAAVRGRNAAYGRGLLPRHRLEVPVVSVGNLTFGGTGKTPTVVSLVRDLVRRGRFPAVLTRGYGGGGAEPCVLVGPDPHLDPAAVGDEPVELTRRLPGVPVVVDPDRVRGGGRARALGADVVVLDDGFQHRRLRRDLDLVLVDAGDPFGGGWLPPVGRLREPAGGLRRASAVLVTKLPSSPEGRLTELEARVHRLAPDVPVLGARLECTGVRTPDGDLPAAALGGRRVLAFAGLGRPAGFESLLEEVGAEVVATRWFEDHHAYTPGDVEAVIAAAAARDAVAVTTGKDAVKLPADVPAWVVEVSMVSLDGSWDRLWAVAPGVLG